MGCRKFKNYKTLLQVSRDGEWIDGGKFPPSLGSFATIPKAKRDKALNKHNYFYLDAVHMDIAFGDCLSVGGFKYALVLVDWATRYNWTFGLKSLSSESILSALRASFVHPPEVWPAAFTVTVILSFLVRPSQSISSTMTLKSLRPRLSASRPMGLWSPIGRSWCTWLGHT